MTRILITDAADDEHWTIRCLAGCPAIRGATPDYTIELEWAAKWAREHAIQHAHQVELVDTREGGE